MKQQLVIADSLMDRLTKISDLNIAEDIVLTFIETEGKYIDYLGISEQNPEYISYLTSDRIARLDENGDDFWNPKKRYHAKPSKVIDLLFPDKYSQRDKELFTERFRNEVKKENMNCDLVTIVEGENIAKYYDEQNYYRHDSMMDDNGGLFQSCMRDADSDYFDIYCQNTSKIAMAVVLTDGEKVRARCILWYPEGKGDGKTVWYDRIYATTYRLKQEVQACLDAKGFVNISPKNPIAGYPKNISIDLGTTDFDYYPYMDTMQYMNLHGKKLYNYEDSSADYELTSTGGERETTRSTCCCVICGSDVDEDDIQTIGRGRYEGEYSCDDCCVYSNEYGEYIPRRDAVDALEVGWVFSDDCSTDYDGYWVHDDRAVTLRNGQIADEDDSDLHSCEEGNYFIEGDEDFVYISEYGYYHVDSRKIEQIDGEYYKIGSAEWEEARLEEEEDEDEDIDEDEDDEDEETETEEERTKEWLVMIDLLKNN